MLGAVVAPQTGATGFLHDWGESGEAFGALPAPEYGKAVDVAPVSGVVRVRLPKPGEFFVLSSELQIPIGSTVDTSAGRVRLVSARNRAGATQSADFFSGRFRVLQPRHGKPVTVLKLEGSPSCAGQGGAGASRPRGGHGLWGSGKGNFRSEGKHGSATVRGTIWWAQDRCDGTLFRVKRGVVTVRDFTRHRTVKIRAGDTYLAPTG